MEQPELENLRRNWYEQKFILFEIAKLCKNRELSFLGNKIVKASLPAIRCIHAEAIDYLKLNFEKFRFCERNFDMFLSVATFKKFPMFSFNPEEKKGQMISFFNMGGFEAEWSGFDFIIDIDADDVNTAYSDAKKLKSILDKFNVPYSLRFSGNRGFHFVVKDKDIFPIEMKNSQKVHLSYVLAENLKDISNIQTIDLTIYDKERILKCPFSLVGEYVCLPLSDPEFERFSKEKMKWDYVLRNYSLKNRGTLTRERIINFKGLMDIYGEEYE